MAGQLLILKIEGIEQEIPIENLPVTIGRYDENHVVLPYDYVSGEHGEIYLEDGEFFYRDLDSLNGTYVESIGGSSELIRNQSIPLGSSGRMVFKEGGAEILYRLKSICRLDETDA